MRTRFCSNCGSMFFPGMQKCPGCGMPLDGSVSSWKAPEDGSPHVVENINPDAPYLPYKPREMQIQIITDIRKALDSGKHIVIESGTGTGKTITSLAGALAHAKPLGKKIVYITRTISQSDQVMKELKAISALQPVSGITLTGRNKSCPLLQARPDFDTLSPAALSTLCSDRKQKSQKGKAGGCSYFDRVVSMADTVEAYCKKNFPRSDEIDAYCRAQNVCPYEVKKVMMKDFDVIVAPYIHIIDPDIRTNFLSNLGVDESQIVLIVDEAHNFMDAVRQQESFTISSRLIGSSLDECMSFDKPEVAVGLVLDQFVKAVRGAVNNLSAKYIGFGKNEALLPPDALEKEIAQMIGRPVSALPAIVENTVGLGREREDAIADTDAPSSPLLEMATLLSSWVRSPADRYVKAVRTGEDGPMLTASCIDPVDICRFMNSLHGAVHMSGTLQPLDNYAKVLGLPKDSIPRTYPSPFPKENKLVVYSKDLTTNYQEMQKNPSLKTRLNRTVAQLCNAVDKNILVFMPSYRMMRDMRPYLEESVYKNLYWEESGRQQKTMQNLDRFRNGRSGVFFCVMGGSVAEGMDFPGDELCFAIIVGIPYPPPSLENKAMKDMFDARYGPGMGWRYTSEIPAVRKMRQAIGRLIRTPEDRGMAVILDNRAARNARQLEAVPTDDPVADAVRFFSKKRITRLSFDGGYVHSTFVRRTTVNAVLCPRKRFIVDECHATMAFWDVATDVRLYVLAGIVLALLIGSIGSIVAELSIVVLILQMTASLHGMEIHKSDFRNDLRPALFSIFCSFVIATVTALAMGLFFYDSDKGVWYGWVMLAAVPAAISVITVALMMKGNMAMAMISMVMIYGIGIVVTPLMTSSLIGGAVSPLEILKYIVLFIAVPVIINLPLSKVQIQKKYKVTFINFMMMFLIVLSLGKCRDFVFDNIGLLVILIVMSFVRVFGVGALMLYWLRRSGIDRSLTVVYTGFCVWKNSGLGTSMCMLLLADYPEAALVCVVSLVMESVWFAITNKEIATYWPAKIYLEETEEFPARSRNVP